MTHQSPLNEQSYLANIRGTKSNKLIYFPFLNFTDHKCRSKWTIIKTTIRIRDSRTASLAAPGPLTDRSKLVRHSQNFGDPDPTRSEIWKFSRYWSDTVLSSEPTRFCPWIPDFEFWDVSMCDKCDYNTSRVMLRHSVPIEIQHFFDKVADTKFSRWYQGSLSRLKFSKNQPMRMRVWKWSIKWYTL